MKEILEKLAPVGSVVAAAGCPMCFPALAGIGSLFGLGALAAYEQDLLMLMRVLVGLSMLLALLSYRRTRVVTPLALSLASGVLVFAVWYVWWKPVFLYIGLAGLVVGALWNLVLERRQRACTA